MTTDPIADLLTQLRNASLARKAEVTMPGSKLKESVARLLLKSGYIEAVKVETDEAKKPVLVMGLRYFNGVPAISGSKRQSKPGRRVYQRSGQLPQVLSGQGLAMVSTSQGLMSAKEARAKHLGGELICTIW